MKPHNIFAGSGMHPAPLIRRAWRRARTAGALVMMAPLVLDCGHRSLQRLDRRGRLLRVPHIAAFHR